MSRRGRERERERERERDRERKKCIPYDAWWCLVRVSTGGKSPGGGRHRGGEGVWWGRRGLGMVWQMKDENRGRVSFFQRVREDRWIDGRKK